MSLERKIKNRIRRRSLRVRQRISDERPRVSVHRSLRHMYAQVIDDKASKTIVGFSSSQLKKAEGDKKNVAQLLGIELARLAGAQGVKKVAFDRGSYRYHGRVKAFAEGLRKGGLDF